MSTVKWEVSDWVELEKYFFTRIEEEFDNGIDDLRKLSEKEIEGFQNKVMEEFNQKMGEKYE